MTSQPDNWERTPRALAPSRLVPHTGRVWEAELKPPQSRTTFTESNCLRNWIWKPEFIVREVESAHAGGPSPEHTTLAVFMGTVEQELFSYPVHKILVFTDALAG